nr:hypothetical protein [Providencia sp. PROV240]
MVDMSKGWKKSPSKYELYFMLVISSINGTDCDRSKKNGKLRMNNRKGWRNINLIKGLIKNKVKKTIAVEWNVIANKQPVI